MKKYWIILLSLAGSSCETVLDVDVPFDQSSLVINSIFNADDTWSAVLTANGSIYLKYNIQPVKNASVLVYENDMLVDSLEHYGDGYYRSSTGKPLDGHEYEFRASADGFETAIGHSNTPVPAAITDLTWKAGAEDGMPTTVFTIKFEDDPNVENFYEIVMEYKQDYIDQESGDVIQLGNPMLIKNGDEIAIQRDDWEYSILLKDVSFNGTKTEVVLKALGDMRYFNI
ncbi:MAG TPA: DUF4249 family protein, partial [Chryseolinea sp.]|nr:DUF4249 family protein [Chryseolinea sp.]